MKNTRFGKIRLLALVLALVLVSGALSSCSLLINYIAGSGLGQTETGGTDEKGVVSRSADKDVHVDPEASGIVKSESEASIYGSAGEDVFAFSAVVNMIHDAVVVIKAEVTTTNSFGQTSKGVSSGSGVIISENGYILTCNHVVSEATHVTVELNDGSKFDAVLVGYSEENDIAVLKIEAGEKTLTYATIGTSGNLVLGEQVVAIGNPLGTLGGTVTHGIVSGLEREITMSDGDKMTLIQTDAAINSGNSGGGLFNLKGELVGIVNAKYSSTGVEGLAFAIPVDLAYPVTLELIEYGYIRGIIYDGLTLLDVLENSSYHYWQGFPVGVYVVSSDINTELKNADRIVSVNGKNVTTAADIEAIEDELDVGDTLTVVYERQESRNNWKQYETTLTLEEYVPSYIRLK